jgi:hypothetical protein
MKSAISGWDNSFYYFWLRSAFLERPFDFRQSIEATQTMPDWLREKYLRSRPTATGRLANKYGVGWAVSSVPFYLIADGIVLAANTCGLGPIPRDGYGMIYQYALLLGQLGYSALGLFLAWRIVRRWVPDPEALQGVLLCWLGSFLFVYQTWMLSMAHHLTFFAVGWSYWAALRVREKNTDRGFWIQVGLAAGLGLITRYQSAIYFIFPAWIILQEAMRGDRQARIGFCYTLLAGAITVSIQLVAWKVVYGRWFLYTYGKEGFDWFQPHIREVLFSSFHGLFYWSPALLIGLVGFLALFRQQQKLLWPWVVSLFFSIWVNAAWQSWWFGASYGSRAFEGCVLFFMLGTAWVLHASISRPWLKTSLVALLLILGLANLTLSHRVFIGKVSLEKPITYFEMFW